MSKVALITGGQRGIGLGIAEALKTEGFRLALAASSGPDSEAVQTALAQLGPDARYYQHDLRSVEAVEPLLDRIESDLGAITSLISNGLQYFVSGPLFGGLSGVVYGILGYCWLSQRTAPRFQFPPALVTFAVAWMVIGFTPLPEIIGLGRMANEAHLGGFIAGLALAVVLPVRRRRGA